MAGGDLDSKVCVGVRSDEGPNAIVDRADVAVDGVGGLHRRAGRRVAAGALHRLPEGRRPALRGAGSALAAGHDRRHRPRGRPRCSYTSPSAGGDRGDRRPVARPQGRPTDPASTALLAGRGPRTRCPRWSRAAIIFNRLWRARGLHGRLGGGGPLRPAGGRDCRRLRDRRGTHVAQAGVRRAGHRGPRRRALLLRQGSPFGAPKLLRTPGLRKIEPIPETVPTTG